MQFILTSKCCFICNWCSFENPLINILVGLLSSLNDLPPLAQPCIPLPRARNPPLPLIVGIVDAVGADIDVIVEVSIPSVAAFFFSFFIIKLKYFIFI